MRDERSPSRSWCRAPTADSHAFADALIILQERYRFDGILGEINGLVAAGTNDILARAVVFGVVIMIIVLKPKGLFSLRGR